MKTKLRLLRLAAPPVVAFHWQHTQAADAAEKPNIVFILMDNLGYGEPGVYGGGITRGAPTPHRQLATEGSGSSTSTSRRSARRVARLHDGALFDSLGHALGADRRRARRIDGVGGDRRRACYPVRATSPAAFGKWHLGSVQGRLPNDQGFDEWYGIPRTTDEAFWPSGPAAKAVGVTSAHHGRPQRREEP